MLMTLCSFGAESRNCTCNGLISVYFTQCVRSLLMCACVRWATARQSSNSGEHERTYQHCVAPLATARQSSNSGERVWTYWHWMLFTQVCACVRWATLYSLLLWQHLVSHPTEVSVCGRINIGRSTGGRGPGVGWCSGPAPASAGGGFVPGPPSAIDAKEDLKPIKTRFKDYFYSSTLRSENKNIN